MARHKLLQTGAPLQDKLVHALWFLLVTLLLILLPLFVLLYSFLCGFSEFIFSYSFICHKWWMQNYIWNCPLWKFKGQSVFLSSDQINKNYKVSLLFLVHTEDVFLFFYFSHYIVVCLLQYKYLHDPCTNICLFSVMARHQL